MDYNDWTTGKKIPEKSVDLVVRLLFMQKMHLTYPVTGTVCTVAAAMIPGTIANQLARKEIVERGELRIGHPAGIIAPEGKVVREKGGFETIDPRYRNALLACARDFIDQFKRNAVAAFERNSAAATAILLNSLAQSGKNDAQILQLLQQIHAQPEDLPILLENVVALQLLPAIKTEIQHEFNRFREDWQFILKVLRFETSRDEEAEREWLEQLAQVMEWKGFHIVSRAQDPDIPGELFEIEDKDRFGNVEKLICWGWPLDVSPDKSKIQLVITTMKDRSAANYFIVSQARLDHATIQYLNQQGITTHKTLPEFVQTILDISRHRQTVISDYEKKAIYRHYIDLFGHLRDHADTPLDLQAFFHHWLQQDGITHISLLGDFGTGKTEFCRRMQWQLLKNYQPTKTRIPVVIPLRDQKGLRLHQMIDSIMNQMGLKQIDYAAFRTLNRMGLFVILIDGFDEMAIYANLDEMIENFRELAVLAEGKAKVCITCRTHYFESQAREQQVMALPEFIALRPEFQILYLNLFTRPQIEVYLVRVQDLRKDKRDVLAEMDRQPQLRDLMQTPVLLDLILKILPELMDPGALSQDKLDKISN
jgi:hypothetical protein